MKSDDENDDDENDDDDKDGSEDDNGDDADAAAADDDRQLRGNTMREGASDSECERVCGRERPPMTAGSAPDPSTEENCGWVASRHSKHE
jgi:hypothetical protein